MPLAAPPGPLWTADAKEPHPLEIYAANELGTLVHCGGYNTFKAS